MANSENLSSSKNPDTTPLWRKTPLILSSRISSKIGCPAYLKLENLHPSHSYKFRGMSLFVQRCREKHGPDAHLFIASGGNAGLAAACAADSVGLKCSVYVPQWTSSSTVTLLEQQHAKVVVGGSIYQEAFQAAKTAQIEDENGVLIPAYDDPILWEGHSSMVKEIAEDLPQKPAAIFCSVGGGGMLGGIIVGCKAVGWDDVPIVAVETIGSNCFYYTVSVQPGQFNPSRDLPPEFTIVEDGITLAQQNSFSSLAFGSLGASTPAPGVVRMALERKGHVKCVSIPDAIAINAALRCADEQKLLVELACSTTLGPAYTPELFSKLVPNASGAPVVFIVCGGFKTSLEDMTKFNELREADLKAEETEWEVLIEGERCKITKS